MAEIRLTLEEAGSDLPPVCMVCGATATAVTSRKLNWWPAWTYVLLLVHPMLWGLVALVISKRARLQAPFCPLHQRHWYNRSLLIWGAGLILFLCAAASFLALSVFVEPDKDFVAGIILYLLGMGLITLWVALIIGVQLTSIRPKVITKTEIVLKGVAEAFVSAVQEADRRKYEVGRPATPNESAPPDAIRAEMSKMIIGERMQKPETPPASDTFEL